MRRQGQGDRGQGAGDSAAVALIVLAAGGSSRLGTPKQLVRWRGRTLLRRAATTAVGCVRGPRGGAKRAPRDAADPLGPVVVVLGAGAPSLRGELRDLPVHIAVNRRWREGIASSLRAGLRAVLAASGRRRPAAVLFLTCDQPHVTPALLRRIVRRFRRGAPIVASAYAGTVGVPALFAGAYFRDLATLSGDHGAKGLLARRRDVVVPVRFALGAIDVDRPRDLPAQPLSERAD